jgi:hypothetical protein
MREILLKAPDADYLASEAARLGFMDNEGNIITNGAISSGGGWFFNTVGIIYEPITLPVNPNDPWPALVARDGYWGRLRINGEPREMPVFSNAIIQYVWSDSLQGWTTDGRTLAPEWAANVGLIA